MLFTSECVLKQWNCIFVVSVIRMICIDPIPPPPRSYRTCMFFPRVPLKIVLWNKKIDCLLWESKYMEQSPWYSSSCLASQVPLVWNGAHCFKISHLNKGARPHFTLSCLEKWCRVSYEIDMVASEWWSLAIDSNWNIKCRHGNRKMSVYVMRLSNLRLCLPPSRERRAL
jgi:hypothetical protein